MEAGSRRGELEKAENWVQKMISPRDQSLVGGQKAKPEVVFCSPSREVGGERGLGLGKPRDLPGGRGGVNLKGTPPYTSLP